MSDRTRQAFWRGFLDGLTSPLAIGCAALFALAIGAPTGWTLAWFGVAAFAYVVRLHRRGR